MQYRKLGQSDIDIAPLAFGGNVFGWTTDERTSFSLLDAFVDGGGNLIDTADVYSQWVDGNQGGESETIIGKWLKKSGKRDKVIIATKVAKWSRQPGLSAENLQAAVDGSLQRLGCEVIDVYLAHEDDAATPLTETLGAFARLIEQGKVRSIGASNYSAARFVEALQVSTEGGLPRYECVQPQYNLMERSSYEAELQEAVLEHKVGVISYYALASGFLSGKYRSTDDLSDRARGGSVEKYLNAHGLRVLRVLDDIAKRHSASPVQVSLAWLMARPGITAPIASATSISQLGELLAAIDLQLDQDDMETLDKVSG